jgi:hypothetical protein
VAVAAALLTASWVSPALAQGAPPNPDASSVEQYVELVPTSSGPAAPGVGREQRIPLPLAARHALEKTSRPTADALLTVATSSTYGAPTRPHGGASRLARAALASVEGPSRERSLRAVAAAAAPDGVFRMFGLPLALAAITVGAATVSVRRRF